MNLKDAIDNVGALLGVLGAFFIAGGVLKILWDVIKHTWSIGDLTARSLMIGSLLVVISGITISIAKRMKE